MAGKREKKREDPMAVWLSTMCRLLKGGALAAATAALGLLVCALLVSGGVVGEKLMGRGVLAICVVSSLAGGLLAVRRLERGTLLAGLGVGVILFLLLLTAGFLLYEEASLSNGGVPILVAFCCGGAIAGVLGGRPRKKRKR